MSTLAACLRARILANGPITLADYMRMALTHPQFGYYMKKDVFGNKGDFITSPEISQMFGELIALWIVNEWNELSAGRKFNLVELGPGRGTLVSDILRVSSKFPSFSNSISGVYLFEVSPAMRYIQQEVLQGRLVPKSLPLSFSEKPISRTTSKSGHLVKWIDKLSDIPQDEACTFVVHEFFDALPIHKFQLKDGRWHEVLVGLDNAESSKLSFFLSNGETPAVAAYLPNVNVAGREHIEICPEAGAVMEQIGQHVFVNQGNALIIDYGHNGSKTDTFRCFSQHKLQDPLVDPGSADLTADVDFSYLQSCLHRRPTAVPAIFGPVSQRHFLTQMGIGVRLSALLRQCQDESRRKDLYSGAKTLLESMGVVFQFMCLSGLRSSDSLPPGFVID